MKRVFLGLLLIVLLVPSAFDPVPASTARKDKVILWTRFVGKNQEYKTPVLDSERLYIGNPTSVMCFGIDSGELLWERDFNKPEKIFQLQINVSINKKYVYFCNTEGLSCLDKVTGKTVWVQEGLFTSNAELALSYVYVASNNAVFQFDAQTGNILQLKDFCDKEMYRFLTYAGKDRLIASTYHGTRKMINISTGEIEWEDSSILSDIQEKPIVSGKNLIISGNMFSQNKFLVVDLESGKVLKQINNKQGTQFDVTDGKILLPDRCVDSETLESIWSTAHGNVRSFDCFDTVCFWDYDTYKILDWNGNEISSKSSEFYPRNTRFYDSCITKPATSDGRYFLLTQDGCLVCYGNKPETIIYTTGDDFIVANGKKIKLEYKPKINNKGELILDPSSFLEPLGWVASHYKNTDNKSMFLHNYKKQVELYDSYRSRKTYRKIEGIPCLTESDGTFIMPLEQMVSEFGLTMTKDGDRINLSYQSK